MIAGELESLDRFQLMERCRMLVGIFEKVALYEFGIEVWDGLDTWEMPKKTAYDHPSGPPMPCTAGSSNDCTINVVISRDTA